METSKDFAGFTNMSYMKDQFVYLAIPSCKLRWVEVLIFVDSMFTSWAYFNEVFSSCAGVKEANMRMGLETRQLAEGWAPEKQFVFMCALFS